MRSVHASCLIRRATRTVAVPALAVCAMSFTAPGQVVRAEDASSDVIIAHHVNAEQGVGRLFTVMSTPTSAVGTMPAAPTPLTGTIEVCAKGPEEGGYVAASFDDGTDIEMTESGCTQKDIIGVSGVALVAQLGEWNIIIRRLNVASPGTTSYTITRVSGANTFGRNIALMTSPPTDPGTLPETIIPYSGQLEVCARSATPGGDLRMLVGTERVINGAGPGCQIVSVSGAISATVAVSKGEWDVMVRRLP